MPKSRQRCVTSLSTSSNVPGSNSSSMRSRALSLPAACWRSSRSCPPPSAARRSSLHRLHFLPILQELLEADGRERMVEELIDHRGRTGRDVGAHPRGLDDVDRMTAAGDEDLGGELVVVVDLDDLANELHAVGG